MIHFLIYKKTLHYCSEDLQTVIENFTYDVKTFGTYFKINYEKKSPKVQIYDSE